MLISFFEEFPTKENLKKLELINFNTKLYIAANSYKDFKKIKDKIKNKFVKEFIYWPLLKKEEGYWISPLSEGSALSRIFNEIKNKNIPVMLDLEFPIDKKFLEIIKGKWKYYFLNKKLIENFIKNNRNVYVCEYYPEGKYKDEFLSFLGMHFNVNKFDNKLIKMVYHSMHKFDESFIRKEINYGVKNYKNNYLLAYGAIAKGISGKEPLLSLKQLDKDLSIAKELNVNEVIIFRLGGLNKNYLNIIKKYV